MGLSNYVTCSLMIELINLILGTNQIIDIKELRSARSVQ